MSSIVIAGDTSGTCTLQAANVAGNTVLNLPTTSGTLVSSGGAPSFTTVTTGLGNATAPSITFTGDTNTGIFSPTADTIAFSEGGVESMRIDSSGNVGIGTSSPRDVAGYVSLGLNDTTGSLLDLYSNGTRVGGLIGVAASVQLGTASAIPLIFNTDTNERMRIDSSGNVGIGTNNPGGKLDVIGTSLFRGTVGGRALRIAEGGVTTIGFDIEADTNAGDLTLSSANGSGLIAFKTAGSERMRITSTGLLQFNSGYGSVATAYGCRAWVNYNAVSASIRGSGNVSSVTNNGAGDNTINFTTAMPDVNYSWSIMQQLNGTGNNDVGASGTARNQGTNAWGTSFLRILTMSHSNTTQENPLVLTVAVFR